MHKNNWQQIGLRKYQVPVCFLVILNLLLTVELSFFNIRAIAQETNNQPENTNQEHSETEPDPPVTTRRRTDKSSILTAIWQLLVAKREQEPALSSRSNICEITPGLLGDTNLIYSDRPLFLWQGTASDLEVNLYSPFSLDSEQELLWSQTVNSESQKAFYTGDALQPGQIYDWEIIIDAQGNRRRISFQVMEKEERDRLTTQLQQLETQLANRGATPEEIALAKANYFAEQDLWSDALQQLHTLKNPSTIAVNKTAEITAYICQSEQANLTK